MTQKCIDCGKSIPPSDYKIRCYDCWKAYQNGTPYKMMNGLKKNVPTVFIPPSISTIVEPTLDEKMAIFDKNELIKCYYSDGEYLSGYSCYSKAMEVLGLAPYVSGWGQHISDRVIKDLGIEFTLEQAIEYIRPKFEAETSQKLARKQVEQTKITNALAEAQSTGKQIIIKQWTEECDGSEQECDVDNLTEYINPDGTHSITRSHSY